MKLKLRINFTAVFYFLILVPFMPIEYITEFYPIITTICSYLRLLVIAVIAYRMIYRKKKLTIPIMFSFVYVFFALLSSYLGHCGLYLVFFNSVFLIGITMIMEDGLQNNCECFFKGVIVLFEILVYANLLYYFYNPSGYLPDYHLFGNYNTVIRKFLPGLLMSAIYAFRLKKRVTVRFVAMYLAVLIYLVCVGSITSIAGMLVFMAVIIIYSVKGENRFFRYNYFIIFSVVISFVFVVVGSFSFIQNIIVNVFKKDMTLSNRTIIWEHTIPRIKERFIFGYGQTDVETTRSLLFGYIDPHNIYLSTLYYGGFIGIILLGVVLYTVGKKINKGRKYGYDSVFLFEAVFCAYFLMWNFEPFADISQFYKMYIVCILAYHCRDIEGFCNQKIIKLGKTRYKIG